MSDNILDSEYVKPNRPYSQDELNDMRNALYRQLRLSKDRAFHSKCKHLYNVKENSKKQKEIYENNDDIGNCSVCWKLSKTPEASRYKAYDLIRVYNLEFKYEPTRLDYNLCDIENIFYRWLYN